MSSFDLSDWLWPDAAQGRQPQGPVVADYPGIEFALIGGQQAGLYKGMTVPTSSNAPSVLGQYGLGAVNNVFPNRLTQWMLRSGARSIIALARLSGTLSSSTYPVICNSSTYGLQNRNGVALGLGGDLGDGNVNRIYAIVRTNAEPTNQNIIYGAATVAVNTWYAICHRMDGLGNHRLDGPAGLIATGTYSGNPDTNAADPYMVATPDGAASIAVPVFLVLDRYLPDVEMLSLLANPWQIFQPQTARIYSFSTGGAVNVSPSITGVVGTTAVGTLISSVTAIPPGVSATGSAGTLTPTTAEVVSLVGVAATGAAGTLSVEGDVSIGITGVQATSAAQAIIVEIDKALTGVSATGAVQALGVEIDAAFTGITATGQVGTVGVSTGADASIAFIGVVGTGAAQALTVEIDETPIGVTGTGQVGNLSESTGAGGVFTGVAATGSAGSVTTESDVAIGLAGASAVGQAGMLSVSIGSNISVSITGVVGTAIAGILLPEMAANDPGVEATGQAGNLGTLHLASLNGVVCYGQVGGLQAGEFLLIRNRVGFAPRFSTTVSVTPKFSATVSKGVKF